MAIVVGLNEKLWSKADLNSKQLKMMFIGIF
jgi:hypothetical protein